MQRLTYRNCATLANASELTKPLKSPLFSKGPSFRCVCGCLEMCLTEIGREHPKCTELGLDEFHLDSKHLFKILRLTQFLNKLVDSSNILFNFSPSVVPPEGHCETGSLEKIEVSVQSLMRLLHAEWGFLVGGFLLFCHGIDFPVAQVATSYR